MYFATCWRRLFLGVALFALTWASVPSVLAQEVRVVSVEYEVEGSEPPPHLWMSCIDEFAEKWTTYREAEACLNLILATSFFKEGSIERQDLSDKGVGLVFHLVAPALRISKISLLVDETHRQDLLNWLAQTSASLHVGETYDWNAQRRLEIRVDEWFRMNGQKVGVASVVKLNYGRKSAEVSFEVTAGPSIAKELPPVRSTDECEQTVVALNWTGMDDHVPLDLVRRLTKTRGAACFRQDWIGADLRNLNETGAFSKVRYDVKSSEKGQQISLVIEGKPLHIASVDVRGYGLSAGLSKRKIPPLAVKAGDVYLQSRVAETRRALLAEFSRAGRRTEVTEEVHLQTKSTLGVRFNVLSYEEDKVIVDGRLYPIPKNPQGALHK